MPHNHFDLLEDLGNLAQLDVGPLINVLKQHGWSNPKGNHIGGIEKSFHRHWDMPVGSNSPVVDIGNLKDGIKTLRKAFKTYEAAAAFAVYIGGKAAMFGTTDSDTLAGSSRAGRLAYDFRPWEAAVKAAHEKEHADKPAYRKPSLPNLTTIHSADIRNYRDPKDTWDNPQYVTKHYAGDMISTSSLAALFTIMQHISKEIGEPITGKLVLRDMKARETRRARSLNKLNKKDIVDGVNDLKTRLTIYKNNKKPSVDTIEDFIARSLKKPGSIVQFAGRPYNLSASTYDKLDPLSLLKGKSFTTSYASNEPSGHNSVQLTYRFDADTNQLLPISATWNDNTNPDRPRSQTAVLDPKGYLLNALGIKKLDKPYVIPKLLEKIKNQRFQDALLYATALEKLGLNWPEIKLVKDSAQHEIDLKNK
jgi:hypothetical protein